MNYGQQVSQQGGWTPGSMHICRKKNEALKKCSSSIGEYVMWRDRMLDHLCRNNREWRTLLEPIQSCQAPILRSQLIHESCCGCNGWELAQMLENFIIDWLSDGLYKRRVQLCGGEKGNGFEMWRYLYQEFHGGSDAVHLGGARRLQEWPRCTNIHSLAAHLDDWVECLQTHCADLLHAPGMVRTMLLGIIPTDFEDELLSKPHIKSWQEIINWCKLRTIYKRQKTLAEATRKPGGGRVNALSSFCEDLEEAPESKPVPEPPTPAWA